MANPSTYGPIRSCLNELVPIGIDFAVGSTGAVGAILEGNGFRQTTPVVRNSAGNYDFFLEEGWQYLAGFSAEAVGADTHPLAVKCVLNNSAPTDGSAPKLTIVFNSVDLSTGAAVPTDPASGDHVKLIVWLRK